MRVAILFTVIVLINYCSGDSSSSDPSSCKGRCNDKYSPDQPCGCNTFCTEYHDCCSDYEQLCGVTDTQLRNISNVLSLADVNAVGVGSEGVQINLGGKASGNEDQSPDPLITSCPNMTANTYEKFLALRPLYTPDVNKDDRPSKEGWNAIDAFLDSVLSTQVMVILDESLKHHQLLKTSLKDQLKLMWFTAYSRASNKKTLGSSGFEHSFMGEVKGKTVEGFHNWISYMIEEQAGNANYYGYIRNTTFGGNQAVDLADQFTWLDGSFKQIGGYLIGTSVEYDLAVFTLCWLARPNSVCEVQLQEVDFQVQTYVEHVGDKKVVGSAYPV